MCPISDGTIIESGSIIQSASLKIEIELSKPLPRINQYPIYKEDLSGTKPIIEDYVTQSFIPKAPCNTSILPVEKNQRTKEEVCPEPLSNKQTLLSRDTLLCLKPSYVTKIYFNRK